jgi:hypothetical protein
VIGKQAHPVLDPVLHFAAWGVGFFVLNAAPHGIRMRSPDVNAPKRCSKDALVAKMEAEA